MLYIIHAEPQFIVKQDLLLTSKKGEYYLEAGRILGLLKSEDGRRRWIRPVRNYWQDNSY